MKTVVYSFLILITIASCAKEKQTVERFDFENTYLFNEELVSKITADSAGMELDRFATDYSLKSDFIQAQILFDSLDKVKLKHIEKAQIDSLRGLFTPSSAAEYIIDKSEENRLIIINESHHIPYHRTFTESLLKDLYRNGYRHLGLEALNVNDTLLMGRGHPITMSGFYTKEPEFGNMIRSAIAIGFNVFGYEDFEEARKGGEFREIAQAKNIKKVMDNNPNDKILIHCGYGHASEGENSYWGKAMAGRLSEMTGVNPLTINQSEYSERSSEKLNNQFLQAFSFEEVSVLIDETNQPIPYIRDGDRMDIAVFHPVTKFENQRPSWKFKNKEKVALNISDLNLDFPLMILVYDINDDISEATPIDIVEKEDKDNVVLALNKGNYKVVITNGKESIKFDKIVK